MIERVRLGELLVESGVISRDQLAAALELQREDGRRLGTLLVEQGLVTETQVTQILSQQLSVPWVSLYHIDFSRQLLDLVPKEIAERFCLVPIFVRRVRGVGETLYVAMDDPSDEAAQEAVRQYSGLAVRAMIAPPCDIRSAIRAYYVRQSLAPTSIEPEPLAGGNEAHHAAPPPPSPIVESPPSEAPPTEPDVATVPPFLQQENRQSGRPDSRAEESPPDSSVPIPSRQIPQPKRGLPRQMITLTLLDGTEVTLPALPGRGAQPVEQDVEGSDLTARDLVEALRATAHGVDARAVLGDHASWESLVGALLSLLLRKHLIADWEFVEEFERFRGPKP